MISFRRYRTVIPVLKNKKEVEYKLEQLILLSRFLRWNREQIDGKRKGKKTCSQIVGFSFVSMKIESHGRGNGRLENEKRTISFEEIVVFREQTYKTQHSFPTLYLCIDIAFIRIHSQTTRCLTFSRVNKFIQSRRRVPRKLCPYFYVITSPLVLRYWNRSK